MIKIEVKSADTERNNGTTKAGKPFPRKQTVWAHLMDKDGRPQPYPVRVRLVIWDDQEPYAPGLYVVSPTSLYTDRFDEFAMSTRLMPLGEFVDYVKREISPSVRLAAAA